MLNPKSKFKIEKKMEMRKKMKINKVYHLWFWYKVCIKCKNLYKNHGVTDFVNNLYFSLYIILSVYYRVIDSEK